MRWPRGDEMLRKIGIMGFIVGCSGDGTEPVTDDAPVVSDPMSTADTGPVLMTDTGTEPPTVADLIQMDSETQRFAAALGQTGLDLALDDRKAMWTVFVPSDGAFAQLGAISPSQDTLANILLYHMIPAEVAFGDLAQDRALLTASGLQLQSVAQTKTLGGAPLGTPLDQVAANGIVHRLDAVAVPPPTLLYLEAQPEFSTLLAMLNATGLSDSLAPNTLAGGEPFTLLAPTNQAFADAGISLGNPPANIASILLNHVISGQVLLGSATDGTRWTTAWGDEVEFDVAKDGSLGLLDAQSTRVPVGPLADVRTLSGAVHAIEGVLDPE
ncbi:MAG: fasciclin domain-containing protein [Myxococcota bacterium]